ncbi:MAG: elongation factor P [Candidatus Brocadiia bacterium]
MPMISATEIRNGIIIKFNNELHEVVDYTHVAPGNWRAMVQAKMRNLKTNKTTENRFSSSDKVEHMMVEGIPAQFSYKKGNEFVFMNSENYEEIHVDKELLGTKAPYLIGGLEVTLYYCEGSVIEVRLPVTVDLKITQTDPPMKTATITNVNKPATLETGLIVNVPPFIEIGEVIKVDTRDNSYVGRVGK